jgi:Bacteriophage HK97-gp10, putative tail-component
MGVIWRGLDEHARALAELPTLVQAKGDAIVTEQARAALTEIRAAYPVRTGRLRDSLTLQETTRRGAAVVTVINTASYALPFEYGHRTRLEGQPARAAGKVFVPATIRARRGMWRGLGRLARALSLT